MRNVVFCESSIAVKVVARLCAIGARAHLMPCYTAV